jgi:30S ribosomal protein S31
MGKGDKKTRRGKIIIGTFGVRRRRKKADKQEIKPAIVSIVKEVKEKKAVKEKAEVKEVKATAEVKEVKVTKEKTATKAPKAAKEKKEVTGIAVEPKPKKGKKSES